MSDMTQTGNDGQKRAVIVTLPPHFPNMHTREQVSHFVAFGLTEEQIAVLLRCTVEDVKLYYGEELAHGLARVNARVMAAVLHAALHTDSAADRKLWLMNRAGWKGGDGAKVGVLNLSPGTSDGETVTVVEKRAIIERVLTRVTQEKRLNERVIDVEPVEVKRANGNGHGGANGTKHR